MKKNMKPRLFVLSTLAGLTFVFLGAAVISFMDATTEHQNSYYMKLTPTYATHSPTLTKVLAPVAATVMPTLTAVSHKTIVTTVTLFPVAVPPTPTLLSPWEQVQKQVETLRSRLERGSDGYAGLTAALAETEPNETWCSNLLIAIQDFNYLNDTAGVETIRILAEKQNCR